MNQRQLPAEQVFRAIPTYANSEDESRGSPEAKIFDKAEKVVKIRMLLDDVTRLKTTISAYTLSLEGADNEQQAQINLAIQEAGERIKSLENIIDKARENQQKEENERS
ncbi:MAG: hypothetical protein JKX92_09340 [Porticoccaceae bacterium]|nr:hypothetical protein [Porticoccaceae bacterium]